MQKNWWRSDGGSLVAIWMIVLGVFSQCLAYQFLSWDDDLNVTGNSLLLTGDWQQFWRQPYQALYIPPVYTVWTLLAHAASPLSPVLFHATNVLIHAVNASLVYAVVRLCQENGKRWVATAAALLFALHPLQVEAVAWVTGLRDLLSAACVLSAVVLYLAAPRQKRPWQLYTAAWLVYLLAVLSKPAAVALPAALVCLEWATRKSTWRQVAVRLTPWLAPVLPVIVMTRRMQSEALEQVGPAISLGERVVVVLDSYGFYGRKFIWPANLAMDYGHTPQAVLGGDGLAVDSAVLAVFACVLWAYRQKPQVYMWLLFAAALLLPTSGLVTFAYQHTSTTADHYAYVAMAGLATALMVALSLQVRWRQAASPVVAGLIIMTATAVTLRRLPVWERDQSLYPAMVAANPRSFAGWIGMAALALREHRYHDGLAYVQRAQEIEPLNIAALANKGLALARLGRFDDLLADLEPKLPDRGMVLRFPLSAPDMATLYTTVAYAMIKKGKLEDSLLILCYARFADQLNPDVLTFLPLVAAELKRNPADPALCPLDLRRPPS